MEDEVYCCRVRNRTSSNSVAAPNYSKNKGGGHLAFLILTLKIVRRDEAIVKSLFRRQSSTRYVLQKDCWEECKGGGNPSDCPSELVQLQDCLALSFSLQAFLPRPNLAPRCSPVDLRGRRNNKVKHFQMCLRIRVTSYYLLIWCHSPIV